VIRSIVLSLHYHYGVTGIHGFRYGFQGLSPSYNHRPMLLDPDLVDDIHQKGGSILGMSRGPQDVGSMLDTLQSKGIGVLFVIGGDGALRGARAIVEEAGRRQAGIAVIGIPKTIDNDISYVQQSFGFATAVSATRNAVYAAHVEATGARNGIGLVKFMGRESVSSPPMPRWPPAMSITAWCRRCVSPRKFFCRP
jgi:6-phosphofructokinase 1